MDKKLQRIIIIFTTIVVVLSAGIFFNERISAFFSGFIVGGGLTLIVTISIYFWAKNKKE